MSTPARPATSNDGPATPTVLTERRGPALWITINRPEKRNALNADVIAGLARGYREAHDDKDVRVIVLTGAGDKAFCTGIDRTETMGEGSEEREKVVGAGAQTPAPSGRRAIWQLNEPDRPAPRRSLNLSLDAEASTLLPSCLRHQYL